MPVKPTPVSRAKDRIKKLTMQLKKAEAALKAVEKKGTAKRRGRPARKK